MFTMSLPGPNVALSPAAMLHLMPLEHLVEYAINLNLAAPMMPPGG
jgi:hypothetical protein